MLTACWLGCEVRSVTNGSLQRCKATLPRLTDALNCQSEKVSLVSKGGRKKKAIWELRALLIEYADLQPVN